MTGVPPWALPSCAAGLARVRACPEAPIADGVREVPGQGLEAGAARLGSPGFCGLGASADGMTLVLRDGDAAPVVFRFAEDFSPLRITFKARSVVVEDGDSRKPDLVIEGSLPDIVHFATVPTLRGRLHGVPDPRQPRGRKALRRLADGRVRIEGNRVLGRRLLRLLAV